jgi:hypothetical protein
LRASTVLKSKINRQNGPIRELKDGSDLTHKNGLFIFELMNNSTEKSDIFKSFPGLDMKEKDLRAKIDILIKTNALDELAKEQETKKEKFIQSKKKVEEEPTTIVVTKFLSQGERKKLMKQQKKAGNEETAQDN